MLLVPIILYITSWLLGIRDHNPFEPLFFISHRIPGSSDADPRYAKGWLDLVFVAYHIIVFAFVRQFLLLMIIRPVAIHLGIRKAGKLDRFGEQAYAILYYGSMGIWGMVRPLKLPFTLY